MIFKQTTKIVLLCLLVLTLVAVGCGKSKSLGTDQSSDKNQQSGKLAGSLQLAGSTSVQPLAEELAAAFMKKNPDVKINIQGGGSSAGVKAVEEGIANAGMASRELKEGEEPLGLIPMVIAKDGIAVVINPANQVTDLSMENIKAIFSGEISNWKDLGGSNASIVIINREEGSGTRDAFEELVLGKNGKFTANAAIQNSTGAVRTGVAGDPNAIGFISMGSINQSIKTVKVNGVDATAKNVLNGSYKISRPFSFLTKGEPAGLTKEFIDWVISAEGQAIVGEEFIPISK